MLASILCALYLSTQALPLTLTQGLLYCPSDWLHHDGSCYRFYSINKPWNDASKFCQEKQGNLVNINSAAENQFVYQNMAVNKTLWIGLIKDRNLSMFRWSNGENLTFQNWIEKLNISGNEDCGEMTDYSVFNGMWNDKPCSTKLPFTCEKAGLHGRYFKTTARKRLINHLITYVTVSSDLECLLWCQRHGNCSSMNYRWLDLQSAGLCELNDANEASFPGNLMNSNDFDYHATV